jgi:hypothetical protein
MQDCNGIEIKEGDIVADTVTLNKDHFKDPFSIFTVRKYSKSNHGKMNRPKSGLILDGAYCYGALEDRYPEDLFVLTPGVNMQDVFCHFASRQRKHKYDGWNKDELERPDPPHWKQTPLGMLTQIVRLCLKQPPLNIRDVAHVALKTKEDLSGHGDEVSYLSGETIFFAEKILEADAEGKRLEDQRKLWKLEAEGDIAAGI